MRYRNCDLCGGDGLPDGDGYGSCTGCKGRGYLPDFSDYADHLFAPTTGPDSQTAPMENTCPSRNE